MKYVQLSFDNGYLYEGTGIGRKMIAHIYKNGEIYECGFWKPIVAYFDVNTGGIYAKKGAYCYYDQLARIERNGNFYVGNVTLLTNGEYVGRMYRDQVEKLYNYFDPPKQEEEPKQKTSKAEKKDTQSNYLYKGMYRGTRENRAPIILTIQAVVLALVGLSISFSVCSMILLS